MRAERAVAMHADQDSRESKCKLIAPVDAPQACLVAAEWDMEKAYDALRKKGLAAAAKKSSRHASEGLVGLAATAAGAGAHSPAVAVVEINSETDFVSRGDLFRGLVAQVGTAAWGAGIRGPEVSGGGRKVQVFPFMTPDCALRQPTPSMLALIGAPSGIPGIAAALSDDPPGRPSWIASAGGPSRPEAARHLGLARAPAGPGEWGNPLCLTVGQPSGRTARFTRHPKQPCWQGPCRPKPMRLTWLHSALS